jgi:hypothetical protein
MGKRYFRSFNSIDCFLRRTQKQTCPPALRPTGTKVGDGSAPCSLSHADIRHRKGCRLPDAILHGKRSFRPRSRAVQPLAKLNYRVRLFSLLRLVVAPPACKPDQDTPVIILRVLTT